MSEATPTLIQSIDAAGGGWTFIYERLPAADALVELARDENGCVYWRRPPNLQTVTLSPDGSGTTTAPDATPPKSHARKKHV